MIDFITLINRGSFLRSYYQCCLLLVLLGHVSRVSAASQVVKRRTAALRRQYDSSQRVAVELGVFVRVDQLGPLAEDAGADDACQSGQEIVDADDRALVLLRCGVLQHHKRRCKPGLADEPLEVHHDSGVPKVILRHKRLEGKGRREEVA